MARLFLLLAFCLCPSLAGQSTIWLGQTTDWHAPSNWTNGVPSLTVDAEIDDTQNQPDTGSIQARVRNLRLFSGAELNLGAPASGDPPLLVAGDLDVQGGLIDGQSPIVCQGSGVFTTTGGSQVKVDVQVGTGGLLPQSLELNGITLEASLIVRGNGRLTATALNQIAGDFVFEGQFLTSAAPGFNQLVVGGNCFVQPPVAASQFPDRISVTGIWNSNSNFQPANGEILFQGLGLQQVVIAPGTTWQNLSVEVGADVETSADLAVASILNVGGQLVCTGTAIQTQILEVTGDLLATAAQLNVIQGTTLDVDGTLSLGAFAHEFGANADLQGTLILAPGGSLLLSGLGALIGTGLPDTVVSGTYSLLGSSFAGNFEQAVGAGVLTLSGDVSIEGNASFLGEALATSAGAVPGSLTIGGNLTLQTTQSVDDLPPLVTLGGDWNQPGSATDSPETALVFGGDLLQKVNSAGITAESLSVGSESRVQIQSGSLALQNLLVTGVLSTESGPAESEVALTDSTPGTDMPAVTTVDLILITDAVLVVGEGGIEVSKDASNDGDISGPGTVSMVGTGSLSGSGSYGKTAVSTASTITVSSSVAISETLGMDAGQLTLGAGTTLTVEGNATFTGGTLEGSTGTLFDFNGDVSLTFTSAGTQLETIRCFGDWTADAAFSPSSGSVILDGDGLMSSTNEGGNLRFNDLQIEMGERSAGNGFFIDSPTFTIGNCAGFNVLSEEVAFRCGGLDVEGCLTVEDSGTFRLEDGASVNVQSTGNLMLLGAPCAMATVTGDPEGGYDFTVSGTITASNFAFENMGPNGLVITADASFAASPLDFRGGSFVNGSSEAGSAQLTISRNAPVEFRDLDFSNDGSAEFNVRSTTLSLITFTNFTGDFAGPSFEDDPNEVIEWATEVRTDVASLSASPGLGAITIDLTTNSEVDSAAIVISRSTSSGGPFTALPGSPLATTGDSTTGASYQLVDTGVSYPQRYYYRIEEQLLHGVLRELGTADAVPWALEMGETLFVGEGGFPDIGSAILASPTGPGGGSILVAEGTYPSFTVDRPVTIAAAPGAKVRIDVTSARVSIQGLGSGSAATALYDLELVTTGESANAGIDVIDCDGIVVLDGLIADGGSTVALRIDNSSRVSVQSCELTGTPALRLEGGATALALGGAISSADLAGASDLTHIDTGLGTANLSAAIGSSSSEVSGTLPRLKSETLWRTATANTLELSADPGDIYLLARATEKGWFDLSALLSSDLLLLLDPGSFLVFDSGVLDGGGNAAPEMTVPDLPALWGTGTTVQLMVLRDIDGVLRCGNVRDLILVP